MRGTMGDNQGEVMSGAKKRWCFQNSESFHFGQKMKRNWISLPWLKHEIHGQNMQNSSRWSTRIDCSDPWETEDKHTRRALWLPSLLPLDIFKALRTEVGKFESLHRLAELKIWEKTRQLGFAGQEYQEKRPTKKEPCRSGIVSVSFDLISIPSAEMSEHWAER